MLRSFGLKAFPGAVLFSTGIFFVVLWLFSSVCMAEDDDIYPGKWWRIPEIAGKLELTEVQKSRLDELFMDNRGKLVEFKSALERERTVLDELMEREPLDEAAVMAQLRRLESARTDLTAERFRFTFEVRKILGYGKFQDLKRSIKEAKDKKRVVPRKQY